jgi:phosphoglycolate phosphatase-like HAD superfamily hydrolase
MKQKENIYIFDLHNTLYDEVIEFGCAIAATTDYFFGQAKAQKKQINKDLFFQQLSDAHARIGSDWDNDVWDDVAELRKLEDYEIIRDKAVAIRCKGSEELTKSKAFADTVQTIKDLKEAGNTIYVATEATQNAASDAIAWLELDGVVDDVYAWPFKKFYEKKIKKTRIGEFPANPHNTSLSLQKPHPLILGAIILEDAKRNDLIPQNVHIDDIFSFFIDQELDVTGLERKISENKSNEQQKTQAQEALRAIRTVMQVKEGPYKNIINDIKAHCFYIGDSFFKDGYLARNAEIPFIFAAYGKNIAVENQSMHARGKESLLRVTGWDKFLIKLTQEAGQLPELTDRITPYYICENSFREFVNSKKAIDE